VDRRSPTTAVLTVFDDAWGRLRSRCEGIDAKEYAWAPSRPCWGVGPTGAVDPHDFLADPPPAKTIGWLTWHIAVDALESYCHGLGVGTVLPVSGVQWTRDPDRARELMEQSWQHFRATISGDPDPWRALGESWGRYAEASRYELYLHALDEVAHHGAEIALMRDLWRNRPAA
jgi:hypothetical protein